MSKNVQHMPVTITGTTFCFKYCINLGNDKFGTMTINQKTNLYEEAQKFCKNYGLEPYVAIILQNQMFQQILKIKEQMVTKSPVATIVGRIHKNNPSKQKLYTQECQSLSNCPTVKDRFKTLIDSQEDSKTYKTIKNSVVNDSEHKPTKRQSISKHFEEMFKRHQQIENRKQLSRKASLQKIPFKPTINNLSRKIVDLKRSTMSKTGQNQNYTHKIYTKNVGKGPTSRSKDKLKQNRQNSLIKSKLLSNQTKSKSKLR